MSPYYAPELWFIIFYRCFQRFVQTYTVCKKAITAKIYFRNLSYYKYLYYVNLLFVEATCGRSDYRQALTPPVKSIFFC